MGHPDIEGLAESLLHLGEQANLAISLEVQPTEPIMVELLSTDGPKQAVCLDRAVPQSRSARR